MTCRASACRVRPGHGGARRDGAIEAQLTVLLAVLLAGLVTMLGAVRYRATRDGAGG